MIGEKLNIEQGTQEWFDARIGIITASKLEKCFTGKNAISKAGCDTLAKELVAEKAWKNANEEPPIPYQGDAMVRGQALEAEALDSLIYDYGFEMVRGGFYVNKEHGVGASPDAIAYDGQDIQFGMEVKCPYPKKHIDYFLEGGLPSCHYAQVHLNMMLVGCDYWLFGSYFPSLKIYSHMVEKDVSFCEKIETVIHEVNQKVKKYSEVIGL